MPRVSLAFFTAAALMGVTGMVWGSIMGVTQDHSLSPAHAHLNLLGWVTLAIMGMFYAQAPSLAGRKLAWVNFALSTLGVLILTPMLAVLLRGAEIGPLMAIPELLVIGGMAIFIFQIASAWRRAPA
jgi:cbb3-type cytochrome oxidase subunit 1